MNCPSCKKPLFPTQYAHIEVDQCNSCKGLWLDHFELLDIITNNQTKPSKEAIQKALGKSFKGVPEDELTSQKSCPKCKKNMNTLNYNYSSGVIIDRCPDDHGIWLDHEEIENIQAHKELWEEKAIKSEAEWKEAVEKSVPESFYKEMESTKSMLNSIIKNLLGLD